MEGRRGRAVWNKHIKVSGTVMSFTPHWVTLYAYTSCKRMVKLPNDSYDEMQSFLRLMCLMCLMSDIFK